jgi:membrane fusion protein, heavy metal efflux system
MKYPMALAAMLAATHFLAGCHGPGGGHEHGPADEAAHGHGGGVRYTHYAPLTELFVEFEPLVVGRESAFAAHLTRLADFKAVAEGRLVVVLSAEGTRQEAAAGVSDTPGIFRPVVVPERAGSHRLTLTWTGAEGTSVHDLGVVQVHPDEAAAHDAASPDPTGFAYTKEAQWQTDFASVPVVAREIRQSVPARLAIHARPDAEALLTSPVDGVLRAPPGGWPRVGARVSRGQVLLQVVPRLGGERDAAGLRLDATRMRTDAERARREVARLEGLVELGAVPENRLVDARDEARVAEAALAAANARLRGTDDGAGVAIRSPIAGVILRVAANSGASLQAGQPLIHVADPGRVWVEAKVAESDAEGLRAPGGAMFASGRSLVVGENAELVGAAGSVDPATRTISVVFEADAATVGLPIGATAAGRVYTGGSRPELAVPVSAVTDDAGVPVVFVQLEGESFERRPVTPGHRDGDWLAVTSGLRPGERVVSRGVPQVRLASTGTTELGHGHAH